MSESDIAQIGRGDSNDSRRSVAQVMADHAAARDGGAHEASISPLGPVAQVMSARAAARARDRDDR